MIWSDIICDNKCIDPWLMEKGSCPQCKVDVLKQLGLRDSTNFAAGPEETTNDATLAPPIRDLVSSVNSC